MSTELHDVWERLVRQAAEAANLTYEEVVERLEAGQAEIEIRFTVSRDERDYDHG